MKLLIDIDEQSSKGKLTIDLLKELGFKTEEITENNYAFSSSRKITSEELNNLLDEDELSETLILKDEIDKFEADK